MNTYTKIKDLEDFKGNAALFKLSRTRGNIPVE